MKLDNLIRYKYLTNARIWWPVYVNIWSQTENSEEKKLLKADKQKKPYVFYVLR